MRKRVVNFCVICFFLLICTGCSQPAQNKPSSVQFGKDSAEESGNAEKGNIGSDSGNPEKAQGSRPWEAKVLMPEAPGVEVYESDEISLDVSNTSEGYVMLNYNGSNPKVKFQITTPEDVTYT